MVFSLVVDCIRSYDDDDDGLSMPSSPVDYITSYQVVVVGIRSLRVAHGQSSMSALL